MTKHQNPELGLHQAKEITQAELLESIQTLRALLYRFIPLLNSESIETRNRSSLVLEKIHHEILQILASKHFHNSQDRLECWENEWGRVGYVSE